MDRAESSNGPHAEIASDARRRPRRANDRSEPVRPLIRSASITPAARPRMAPAASQSMVWPESGSSTWTVRIGAGFAVGGAFIAPLL